MIFAELTGLLKSPTTGRREIWSRASRSPQRWWPRVRTSTGVRPLGSARARRAAPVEPRQRCRARGREIGAVQTTPTYPKLSVGACRTRGAASRARPRDERRDAAESRRQALLEGDRSARRSPGTGHDTRTSDSRAWARRRAGDSSARVELDDRRRAARASIGGRVVGRLQDRDGDGAADPPRRRSATRSADRRGARDWVRTIQKS